MKSITEFNSYVLTQGLQKKTALTTEGKTPEEISEALGTANKFEGDKLKHFVAALDVAEQNQEGLSRVLVVSLAEGETVPPKATKVEETTYVPEFRKDPKAPLMQRRDPKGGGGAGKGKGGSRAGGPKESPWGLSPEQKAAKKNAGSKSTPKPS